MTSSVVTADKIITQPMAERLISALKQEYLTAMEFDVGYNYVTDYFLILFAYNTGLRISEISRLKFCDIYDDYVIVRRGKGGKTRTVYFPPEIGQGMKTYKIILQEKIVKSFITPDMKVFHGIRGPLTANGLWRRTDLWFKKMGFPDSITFHSLRHGYATMLLENGIEITAVRDMLGHTSINTTSIYLHFTRSQRDKFKMLPAIM